MKPGKNRRLSTETLADEHQPHALVERFRLVVLEGADAGTTFLSNGPRVVIGTHESAHLLLHDRAVSGFHCELMLAERRVVLRDLDSRNGTRLGGVPVLLGILRAPSTFAIGRTKIRFEW